MAISITSPLNANISDTQASLSVTVGGTIREVLDILLKVNGVTVAALYDIPTATGTFTFDSTIVQAIYTAAKGNTLTGCVSINAYTRNLDGTNAASATLSGGNLTINYRIKNLTLTKPTSGSQWNMDLVSGNTLTASWTRTNSAFFARLKGYIWNGSSWVLVFNRYGWTTSSNIDVVAYGYKDAIVAAMNSVSPRNFLLQIITQFDDGTADYQDLSYTAGETTGNYTQRTASNAVTNTFVTLSTIAINNFVLSDALTAVPFTLTTYGSYPHTVKLYLRVGSTDTLIRTESVAAGVTSGNFTIGATERALILNAMPSTTSATIWAEVTTDAYGSTNSQNVSTTVTLADTYKPTIGTVTWAEAMAYVKTALGYTTGTPYFLTSKSKITFTVPVTNATGATTAYIRVQFAGTDKSSATSPITTDFLITAGSLTAVITVTDSRGRSSTLTTASIVVRAYTYPVVNKFEVYRSDGVAGAYAPLGTYLRCVVKGTASSIKALDGTTEKNWVKYKIDYRVKATGSFSNNAAVVPGGLTFGELTTSGIAGFLAANAYDVRVRVFDAFYDLDGDASTLEDTDDYAESLTILPIGEVSMMLGRKSASFGKVHSGVGTVDVASDANGISINADGKIQSGGIEVVKRVDFVVTDFNAIDPTTLVQGRAYTFNTGFQAANRPAAANYYSGILYIHNISQKYATIMMTGTTDGYVYTRMFNGTSWGNWSKMFTDLTDGAGSGLDADLLDTYQLKGDANSITQDGVLSNGNTGLVGDSCLYYKGTTTTVANATDVQVAVDTLQHNTNTALFTLSGGVITVKKAGVYLITAYVRSTSGTAGGRTNVTLWKNPTALSPISGGTQIILATVPQVASQPSGAAVSIALVLAANDTLVLGAYTTGAGITVGSGLTSNFLNVTKIA